jgi:hypothetical protein
MPTPPDFTNGTALEASSLNSVGLWKIASATFTPTNSLAIDNIFTGAFTDYKIILQVNDVSASVAVQWQLRDGTTNLNTSYFAAGFLSSLGLSTLAYQGENNSAQVIATVPYASLDYGFCDIDLYRPNETQYTMFAMRNMNYRDSPVLMESRSFHGSYQQTTAVEGIRFFTSGATFAGRYSVYGYRN